MKRLTEELRVKGVGTRGSKAKWREYEKKIYRVSQKNLMIEFFEVRHLWALLAILGTLGRSTHFLTFWALLGKELPNLKNFYLKLFLGHPVLVCLAPRTIIKRKRELHFVFNGQINDLSLKKNWCQGVAIHSTQAFSLLINKQASSILHNVRLVDLS